MKVTVYSKPNCPQCDHTKRDMEILGIEYNTVDLSSNHDELRRLVGMGFRSAPIVETEHGSWAGYNQERIKGLMAFV